MQATNEFLSEEEQERHRAKFEKELAAEEREDFDPNEAFRRRLEKQQRKMREAMHREKFSKVKL